MIKNMNENLNLVELLKDCPKGTKFYSILYGDVYFECIDLSYQYPVILKTSDGGITDVTSDGLHHSDCNGECTLFPSREQRDWSKWHLPFKDGDIIFTQLEDKWVSIFKEYSNEKCRTHVDLNIEKNNYFDDTHCLCKISNIIEQRLATEEEKKRLFDAINEHGYRWNAEKKVLEKLSDSKFKDGDIIFTQLEKRFMSFRVVTNWVSILKGYDNEICETYADLNIEENHFFDDNRSLCPISEIIHQRLATDEEKQKLFDAMSEHGYSWCAETKTLEELSESEFKDGDIIFTRAQYSWISIFKRYNNEKCETYTDLNIEMNSYYDCAQYLCDISEIKEQRLATEEEKKLLFEAIKEHGYRRKTETKTLEKLIEPKFKVGDVNNNMECDAVMPNPNITPIIYNHILFKDGELKQFLKELSDVYNKFGLDNSLNIRDYLLAEMTFNFLAIVNNTIDKEFEKKV